MSKKDYVEMALEAGQGIDEIVPLELNEYDPELKERLRNEPKIMSFPSGLSGLDLLFGGFEQGRLYVLSAPTKSGKTTLAQTIMFNMGVMGFSSLFFSFEVSWQHVTHKFMEMERITRNSVRLPILIPTKIPRTGDKIQLQWLHDAIVKAKKYNQCSIVFIDHLHFLLPLAESKNTSFVIGGIVREIKRMANDLNIPIVLIAHTTKLKDGETPTWSNIRDSSFITQEADAVLMLWRNKNEADAPKRATDKVVKQKMSNKSTLSLELDRAKGRSGEVYLWGDGTMFVEYDETKHGNETLIENGVCTTLPMI